MIEELRQRHSSAHVEVGTIGQQRRVFLGDWEQNVAELLEVQLSVIIGVISTEEKKDVIMCEFAETD
jgi:hypothetical protein